MSIGGFKAAKIRATTNKSGQSGVIGSYAENAKDTLTRVKDAIVGFGGWTWNNDLSFISTDGTETVQYITYYTTLSYTNGAQLFISYGASGVQYHWSCFGQYVRGSKTAYPTITESGNTYTLSDGQAGGWFSGLCMSMIPAGSSNHYGTPNRIDNTWMPNDATPILGYLGTNNATYKESTSISTAARRTTGNEYIYIISKDDLFMVMCHDPTWAGFSSNEGMGAPCFLGYVVGRLFENLAADDNAYYAPYGWWGGQTMVRITNGSPYLRNWSGAFCSSATRAEPYYVGNNAVATSLATNGTLGFFRKDGSKFAQEGPNGFLYAEPTNEASAEIAPWLYQRPDNARWYAMEVGVLPITEAASFTNAPVAYGTQIKGTIRTDFMRPYVLVDPRYNTRFRVPPYGTKFENGNFIMGPCNIAIGWDSSFTEAETEELCPWRGQSGFEYNSSIDFGGYKDVIHSIVSNGSKTFVAYTDNGTKNIYIDSASLGGITFDGAVQITNAGTQSLAALNWNGSALILSTVSNDNVQQFYSIDTSTNIATAVGNSYSGSTPHVYNGEDDTTKAVAFCYNTKYDHYVTAWTGWDDDYDTNIKDSIRIVDNTNFANVFTSTTTADSFTGLVQSCCTDIEGNVYIIYQDYGTWSQGMPSIATYSFVIQKLVWDSANSTYKFAANDGTLSSDNTTVWYHSNCGWPFAIVADNYGYIYSFYSTTNDPDATQIGMYDVGVKKMKPNGTICWTKHIGVSSGTLRYIKAIYTYDNKIHISGQTDVAFPGFSQVNTKDTFFGTMTTDGVFAAKYQGGHTNNAVITSICCDDGYDYISVSEWNNSSNLKPKYALLKRTW